MHVKTFEGFNMNEVIKRIKRQFGKEAVILSTKEKILPDSDAKIIEIKAAVAENKYKQGATLTPAHQSSDENFEIMEKIDNLEKKIEYIQEKMAIKEQYTNLETSLKELKLLCMNTLKQKSQTFQVDIPENFEDIYQQLQLTGVETPYLLDTINHLKSIKSFDESKKSNFNSAIEYHRSNAIRFMYNKIRIYPSIKPVAAHTQIHLFVGGSGVGKTCSIAKIALLMQKKEKAKVLLVSYNSKKLAPGELLYTYSKVLNITHVMIEEPSELETVILKHRDHNLILIDSVDTSLKQKESNDAFLQLVNQSIPIEVHLVLSLTESNMQMDRTITKYSRLGIHSILFTKLDESWTYGDMYNVSCKWSIPLSFFATGQKIQDDLEVASRERVIERLFGL